ncbi:6-phosphofructokinase [Treponema rectale]|uniref:ATP-dependent 6-phosphofructokinase n=1 Tax=Treponema rectale TaxID=744512 RepID=A0A840SAI2_9SPIR|nr:ATP-dependent 6-phosphofructokinase [Treponema rectale]MBB5217805.1 6-phosphofructokinase 1 [Treponema rectale]QOS40468.1 6-phosphofructokinase [Treponema rectale]
MANSKSKVKRFGILTSGGDAPGLNAAIRAVCRTAKIQYGMDAVGIRNGYRGLINGDMFDITSDSLVGLLTEGGTILGTSREKPFKNPVADSKGKFPVDRIKENYKKHKLDALVCIGGNGTNTTASLLAEEGLNVIGLPKTIDNDIVKTDMTFGFHTALDVATDAIDRIHTTAHSHSRIMVVEVMGHKAGWLGLYSGIAGGGDVILIPEIPYDINHVAQRIMERKKAGKNFSIVVVAEGAKNKEEALMDKKKFKKARAEMPYSIGYRVAHELEEATSLESRVTVLGYLQRGGTPSPYDRLLATQYGTAAAHFLADGDFGKLVALQNSKITGVPLYEIAGKVKNIPLDHAMIETARELGTCLGD